MKLSHQSLTESKLLQEEVSTVVMPNQAKIEFQILKRVAEEETSHSFRIPFAKLTHTAIRPPTLLETIGRPHTVLQDEPRKELALRWSPIYPNRLRHEGLDHALELSLVGQRHQVGSRGREF
jgi:hypothetical protein